jgi:hypothetical protein
MLTKTLKFDNDVLDVLKAMQWSDDGLLGTIAGGQLERTLYTKVNKALDAMGGKWNRGKGGHVFAVDPRAQVEGLLENGALTVERDGFFETPEDVVRQMLNLVPMPEEPANILEPSAGLGAILRVLVQEPHGAGQTYDVIEKNPARRAKLREEFSGVRMDVDDFLAWNPASYSYDVVYMNPPFEDGQDIEHVRHAYDLLAIDGELVSVMSEGPFFRTDKKAVEFREWLESVDGYSEVLPAGSFKASGTGVNCRLVVISK